MLVKLRPLPVCLAVFVALAPRLADAAPRELGWTGALRTAAITPDEADRAFAQPPIDASLDPVVRVDESALRYYAAQHAQTRVEAEIRRLRALYPGWEPPVDLYRPAAGGEDQALWDLYGRDRIDDLKLEIDRRAARQPGWRPSPEMVEKLRRKEMRNDLVAASDRADWQGVLKLAEREPLLLDGGDVDVIWRIAEATAKTGGDAHALDLYRLALTSATTPDERIGTLRKAMATLGADPIAPLLAEERKGEFEPLRLDMARTRLGDRLRADATTPVAEADLARVTEAARRPDGSASDAALLGWVELKRKNDAAAYDWFKSALSRGGDAKATLGAALAADRAGRHADAVALAAGRAEDAEVGTLFLDLVTADITGPKPQTLDPERLKRFVATIERLESGDAAQALAWYAFNAHQWDAARAWFTKALAWRPTAKSAEGHLLALKALGDRPTFERLQAEYRGRFADMAPVAGFATAGGRGTAAPASCATLLAGDTARKPAGDQLAIGWCLMDLGRGEEALVAFDRARRGGGRFASEAAYGQSMAHLRAGRTDAAAAVAAAGELSAARREEVGRVVLAQQAIAQFDAGDYRATIATLDRRRAHVAETRDLMTLRGWAHYHLKEKEKAYEVFALLDTQMSTRDTRTGLYLTATSARLYVRK